MLYTEYPNVLKWESGGKKLYALITGIFFTLEGICYEFCINLQSLLITSGMIICRFCLFSDMSKESKLPVSDRCRMQSPDRMVNSCNAVTSNDLAVSVVGSDDISSSPLMTRSLDPSLLCTSSSVNLDTNNSDQSENSSTQLVLEDGSTGSRYMLHISNSDTLKAVYFVYFYFIEQYGIILWGNSSNSKNIFILLKKILELWKV